MATDGMNGWDLVAATRQRTINSGLSKLYASERYQGTIPIEFLGLKMKADVDVTFGPPRIAAMVGTGRQTNVVFPLLAGSVGIQGQSDKINLAGANLAVTTSLAAIAAQLQPRDLRPGAVQYDFILDLKSEDAVINVQIQNQPAPLVAFLAETLKIVLRDLADKKRYTLASFSLGGVAQDYPYVIPKDADFTFVRNAGDVDDSTFAVLMRTTSAQKGTADFGATMLPADAKAVTLLSNQLLMREVVRPGILDGLKDKLADSVQGPKQIVLTDEQGLCHIRASSEVMLNQGHDSRIDYLNCYVNGSEELRLEINIKAFATFLDIEVQAGAEVNYRFELTQTQAGQTISLKQTAYNEHHSTSMDWWKWLLAALGGIITTIIVSIIYAVVKGSVPSLDSSMFKIATTVTWPYMKEFEIQKVSLPAAVRVAGDPKLLN